MEVGRLLPVGAVLGLFIGGAWTYLVYMDWGMRHMDVGMDMWIMPQMVDWDVTDLGLVLLMWAVMMAAMMLPSVLPVILVLIRFGGSAHAVGFIGDILSPGADSASRRFSCTGHCSRRPWSRR